MFLGCLEVSALFHPRSGIFASHLNNSCLIAPFSKQLTQNTTQQCLESRSTYLVSFVRIREVPYQ